MKRPLFAKLLLITFASFAGSQSLFRTFESDPDPSGNSGGLSDLSREGGANTSSGSLIWQPLRATFRPLNRQSGPPPPPPVPTPPPPPPEPLPLVSSDSLDLNLASSTSDLFRPSSELLATTTTTTTTPLPPFDTSDEDLPTRVPSGRFRPTRPPSVDNLASSPGFLTNFAANSGSSSDNINTFNSNNNSSRVYRITNECFECICEASTSCNSNSRCQTSDVRHTRCGMFLISYDQWLETGLSKQLVTKEQLARDAAADERAFYECVTDRECAERLMSIYILKNARDCDKDGRITCYDVAAIHQGGIDQCNSEPLLESQYWADFNACFGFAR